MIIVGTRGVTYTKRWGRFRCPACHADSDYRQRRIRRCFTLYFVPIVPLDLLEEFIECGSCGSAFPMGVLDLGPPGGSGG